MKCIKFNKSIFDNIISCEFIKKFHDEYCSENISYNFDYFFSNLKIFIENVEKINFGEILSYLDNPNILFSNNNLSSVTCCKKCKKIVKNKNKKSVEVSFGLNITYNFFCNCKLPDIAFNMSTFKTNINFFSFNIIKRFLIWWNKFNKILLCDKNLSQVLENKNLSKKINSISFLNYEINSLLLDIYSSIDSLKFQVFLINENNFEDEIIVSDAFLTEKKEKIKKIQSDKKEFINLVTQIQKKINVTSDNVSGLVANFNMINLNSNPNNIKWIIKERNKISHNFINICHGNYINLGNGNLLIEIRKKIILLLFIDSILLFYFILFSFDCIE